MSASQISHESHISIASGGACGGVVGNCPLCTAAQQAGQECLTAALAYLSRGWAALAACPPDHAGVGATHADSCDSPGKAPWGRWKQYQDVRPTEKELRRKWRDNPFLNVGLALGPVSGLVRVDIDGSAGEEFYRRQCGNHTPTTLEFSSGNGRGLLFVIPAGITLRTTTKRGEGVHSELRIQAKGGQTIMPPSRHPSGRRYRWLEGHTSSEIAVAPMPDWMIDAMQINKATVRGADVELQTILRPKATSSQLTPLDRAKLYLAKMAPAISGQGGHNTTLTAARAMVYGFDLGVDLGFDVLASEYNPRCNPPWSDEELQHKCKEADTVQFDKPRGWLRDEKTPNHHHTNGTVTEDNSKAGTLISNYRIETDGDSDNDGGAKSRNIGLSLGSIKQQIHKVVSNWPKCAGGMLFVEGRDYQPHFLENPNQLFAWLGSQFPKADDNPIRWQDRGATMISRAQYHEYSRQSVEQYAAVESCPHFPPMKDHYYLHPTIVNGTGAKLQGFLDFFSPYTPEDRQLLIAFLATLVWGGPCGKRPGWLFAGPDQDDHGGRGVGKTTCALKCAAIIGGVLSISDPNSAKAEEIEKRLLSPEGRKKRTIIIDNLKALKFSWAYLEGLITSEIISGRQMYMGEGRRPNNLNLVITANGATLSTDMAQRLNVIKLARPTYQKGDWDNKIDSYTQTHRWEILGDLQTFFDRPVQPITDPDRWGLWQKDILSRLENPNQVQAALQKRANECDSDAEEMLLMRDGIRALIRAHSFALDPDRVKVKISAHTLAELANLVTGEKRATNKATSHVRQLQIPEMGIVSLGLFSAAERLTTHQAPLVVRKCLSQRDLVAPKFRRRSAESVKFPSGQVRQSPEMRGSSHRGGRNYYWQGQYANPDMRPVATITSIPINFQFYIEDHDEDDRNDDKNKTKDLQF